MTLTVAAPMMKHMNSSERVRAKLALHSSQPDAAGHVRWTGKRGHHGRPIIRRENGVDVPAAAVAFEQRTGRWPVGMCRADCDVDHCLAPDHVQDDLERRTVRLQLRALYGWAPPWDICPKGLHAWDEHGRVEPDLTQYCKACNTNRDRKRPTKKGPTT